MGFPHNKQFYRTLTRCPAIQFNSDSYRPEISIRSHRLKTESCRLPPDPPSDASLKSRLSLVLWPICCIGWSFPRPSPLDWITLLEWLTELEKTVYILGYWLIIKGCNSVTVGGREAWSKGMWEGAGSLQALSRRTTSFKPWCVHQPGSSPTLSFGIFMETFITAWLRKSLAIGSWFCLQHVSAS